MKKFLLLIVVTFFFYNGFSQTPVLNWEKTYDNNNQTLSSAVKTIDDGYLFGVYIFIKNKPKR